MLLGSGETVVLVVKSTEPEAESNMGEIGKDAGAFSVSQSLLISLSD